MDPKTGDEKPVVIADDDGIRPQASIADLAKLRPVFKKNGTTTAGNSSQVSDGAGAALLMKRGEALKRGLPILGVFKSFAAVGVDPAVMGIGPAVAIPAAVESAGLKLDDIDLFEINEVNTQWRRKFCMNHQWKFTKPVYSGMPVRCLASQPGGRKSGTGSEHVLPILQAFASQYTYCARKLELDEEKINVNGGAMALGHPLGATGMVTQPLVPGALRKGLSSKLT